MSPERIHTFSKRKRQTLRYLARGYGNDEIAGLMGVSLGTVNTYLRDMYATVGITDETGSRGQRTLLVVLAIHVGAIATTDVIDWLRRVQLGLAGEGEQPLSLVR